MTITLDGSHDDDAAVGAENTTFLTVKKYLMHARGGNLTEDRANELLGKHREAVIKGERVASFANYVGDQILRAEGLPEGE